MRIRAIEPADIPALFAVRTSTHENRLSREELDALGITEDSVLERLRGTCNGWLCEGDGRVVGFAIGDRATGELWVIALLPAYVGRGIGSELLRRVEGWLASTGCRRAWLTTDIDTTFKAYSFYRDHGWIDDRVEGGLRYMTKDLPPPDRAP